MTDKEIIIDGVDVSECNYAILPKKQCPTKSMPYAKETSCIACKEHNTKRNFCKNNPNCYYKRLKRKEQECEHWKNQCLCLDDEYVTVQITQEQFEEYHQYKQALDKLIPILENYATSTIGRKQVDGTYKFVYSTNKFGDELCLNYDPRPAIEGLNIINKVKEK